MSIKKVYNFKTIKRLDNNIKQNTISFTKTQAQKNPKEKLTNMLILCFDTLSKT